MIERQRREKCSRLSFSSSASDQLAYRSGQGVKHHQQSSIVSFEPTYNLVLDCLESECKEFPLKRYQIGSLSHSGWKGIPKCDSLREEAFTEEHFTGQELSQFL